jgi:hypothetical protein
MKKIKIKCYKDLERFIELNFDNISEFDYCELLRVTLGVYAVKPKDKSTAIAELKNFYERYGHTLQMSSIETPLFLHLN